MQEGQQQADDEQLLRELQALRAQRLLRSASVVQDLADSLLALNDVRGMSKQLSIAQSHL